MLSTAYLDSWLQDTSVSCNDAGEHEIINFEAPWLYVKGTRWYLCYDKCKVDNDGIPVDSIMLDFDKPLPDKTRLTDKINTKLKESIELAIFRIKVSVDTRDMDLQQLSQHFYNLCTVADYLILNKAHLTPSVDGMGNLTTDDLDRIYTDYALDGRCGVAKVRDRIEKFFSELLSDKDAMAVAEKVKDKNIPFLNRINNKDVIPKTFDCQQLSKIKAWLFANGAYNSKRGNGLIDEDFIFNSIGWCCSGSYLSAKCKLFIRQFECVTDYLPLEFASAQKRCCEYLSVDHIKIEDEATSNVARRTLKAFHHSIVNFSKIAHTSPLFPSAEILNEVNYEFISSEYTSDVDNRTKTVPVEIALQYLNEAVRWVEDFGDDIAKLYLQFIDLCKKHRVDLKCTEKNQKLESIFKMLVIPNSLTSLNIVQYSNFYQTAKHSKRNEHGGSMIPSMVRRNLSLEDAVNLYIAAITILVLVTSARRASEILGLKTNCIHGDKEEYLLGVKLSKANFEGERAYIKRPIPNVTAEALIRFQSFTGILKEKFGENVPLRLKSLLYVPVSGPRCKVLSYTAMQTLVNKFADYIQIPVDEHSRRWYLLFHQCRRFFAITFFWQHKHACYPALAWFLGHIHPDHTTRYVRDSISGKELTEEEVRITKDAILSGKDDDDGVNKLRKWAMTHFRTKDVRLIKDDLLDMYLEDLKEKGMFHIESLYIETANFIKYKILWKVSQEV